MGNQPLRGGPHPARDVRTLKKLKDDVVAADKLRELPSADALESLGVSAKLHFRVLCSQRVSKKMLPVIWKFNRNVLVDVRREAHVSHFTPQEFYTFFKCLQDIHIEATRLKDCSGDKTDCNTNSENSSAAVYCTASAHHVTLCVLRSSRAE